MKTILTSIALSMLVATGVAVAQDQPSPKHEPRAFVMVPGEFKGQDQDNGMRPYHKAPRHDIDKDGIPNRMDRDMDGDGVKNRFDKDMNGDGRREHHDHRRHPSPEQFKKMQQQGIETINLRIQALTSFKQCMTKAKNMQQLQACEVGVPGKTGPMLR